MEPRDAAKHAADLRGAWGGAQLKTFRRHCHAAFTLIELLTVIAISAVLLTLILIPLFQSFNLTRQALALADAQDRGRILTERIATEMSGAVAVREGGRVQTTFQGTANQWISGNAVIVRVPQVTTGANDGRPMPDGTALVEVALPFSKIDLVRAAEGEDNIAGPGIYRDPITKKIDPTLNAPKGQVKLPIAPGQTLTRYFVSLRDPFNRYNNPYDGLLNLRNGGRDNLYVLYRADISPRRWASVQLDSGGAPQTVYVTDARYFASAPDDNGNDATIGVDVQTGNRVG
ncbi:prepilin-type N-terminal cleavage/methylation domain-containing protein, partial [bacterium]